MIRCVYTLSDRRLKNKLRVYTASEAKGLRTVRGSKSISTLWFKSSKIQVANGPSGSTPNQCRDLSGSCGK